MKMIAHRGYWKTAEEKNSIGALYRALDAGYGFETDLRDYCGRLVISHNIADESCTSAEKIFEYYHNRECAVQLALNVKADGIQDLLEKLLEKYSITNYFLFDMSVPEQVVNKNRGITFYTRHSDIEESCVLYEHAAGVWLDSFYDDEWLTEDVIHRHIDAGKPVCIVSPELHQKPQGRVWKMLKDCCLHKSELVSLCTDIPDNAKEYFGL